MNSTCVICSQSFEARHHYGLCPLCFSKDRAREFDRVESAIRAARRQGIVPITLTLVEWLSTVSDFAGTCAFCRQYTHSVIELVKCNEGLTYNNVVPSCKACSHRRQEGYDVAEDRVKWYLSAERVQHFIPQTEEESA